MKRLFPVLVPLLLCFGMLACKKAKGPANGNSVQQNNKLDTTVSMTATINGSQWHSDSAAAFGYYVKHSGNDSGIIDLMVTATQTQQNANQTITFNIDNYTGPGTYTINPPYSTAAYYINNIRHYADTGTFVVTSNTGVALIGTFFFRADTFTVTSGTFDVALP